MAVLAQRKCIVLSASVNGDSPERTAVHGTAATISEIEST